MGIRIQLIFLLSLLSLSAFSADVFVIVMEKQQQKKSSSWSLAEWMVTKKKIALMDQWLAVNSSSTIVEAYIDGHYSEYNYRTDTDNPQTKTLSGGGLGMFVTIFGLEGNYDESNEKYTDYEGMFSLRILGRSDQGANITASYGYRNLDVSDDVYQNQFWNIRAGFKLLPFIGINGSYRSYLPQKSKDLKYKVHGERIEGGMHMDLLFLRLYGTYFREFLYVDTDPKKRVREGVRAGARIYF